MEALLAEVRDGNSNLHEWEGVPGLHLRFDFLSANGVDAALLHSWRHGHLLGASPVVPRQARNHPSVTSQQLAWAEREWDRLAEVGKVSFFPVDTPPPKHLNVNPCGLILKPRPGADAEADETERFKARLIVDLRRGGVNECMPNVDVAYGTLGQAVARMSAGSWLFVLDLRDCFFKLACFRRRLVYSGFLFPWQTPVREIQLSTFRPQTGARYQRYQREGDFKNPPRTYRSGSPRLRGRFFRRSTGRGHGLAEPASSGSLFTAVRHPHQ